MKVLVSGGTGMMGSMLIPSLQHEGCQVAKIVRHRASERSRNVEINVHQGWINEEQLQGFHAVVHLAGENIAEGRWTAAKRKRIEDSRIKMTRVLCEGLARIPRKPKVLICASAIGYYGDRGKEIVDEESEPGDGYLSKVCQEWEAATQPAIDAGIRVIQLRLGLILTTQGGALKKILPIFRLGLGGPLGLGSQYMSWVGAQDVISAIHFCIGNPAIEGPVNVVAPAAVINREFTRTLARVLKRPALIPAPGVAIKLMMGQMGDELLLQGCRVEPKKLLDAGFEFRFTDLEHALRILVDNGL